MIYNQILSKYNNKEKQLAFLIDPDKFPLDKLDELENILNEVKPDLLLIGGSLISMDTGVFIQKLKEVISVPVILYPGSSSHLCKDIDALLLLSLISGRNPEFLISHHVTAAPFIKAYGIEAISTGYMLIDGGSSTSVHYISQTAPIPNDKQDIAIATALAGQYMGMKMIYMDAGSGASQPIPTTMIESVKHNLDIPLMIGGGLRTEEQIKEACKAGADIIVVGSALEKDISLLAGFHDVIKSF